MTEVDTDYFHQLLLKRREALLGVAETAAQAADTVELDQSRVGRLSRMDALQAQAMSQEGNRRRDLELRRIASALSRIKEGEYGYCLDCGEVIAKNRLEVDPAALLCIGCADKAEK
ncbi:MAG: TraR/DksA family transcriptional regulator [Candidatus Sedimenticola sp. (ex Thyasira tokunagai)]